MAHAPTLQTNFSTTDMIAALQDAMQTPERTNIEAQAPNYSWSPRLKLNTSHVYPALSGKLLETATLVSKTTADSAARARVSTTDIPAQKVPMPPHRRFVPMGVAGGMGPLATVDLEKKLNDASDRMLKSIGAPYGDRDPLGVNTINNGGLIADRTAYLNQFKGDRNDKKAMQEHLEKLDADNPYHAVVEVCAALKQGGAHFIVFPCNTWHAWFDLISKKIELPMLHIAEATVLSLQKATPKLSDNPKIGLIATTGTINSELYQKAAERMEEFGGPKITWVLPDPATQQKAMDGIYKGVKAGDMELGAKLLNEVALELIQQGAEALLEGCTEVDPAIGHIVYPVPQIDAATALAETSVKLSMELAKLERKFS